MRLFLRLVTLCGIVFAAAPATQATAQSTIVQWNYADRLPPEHLINAIQHRGQQRQ